MGIHSLPAREIPKQKSERPTQPRWRAVAALAVHFFVWEFPSLVVSECPSPPVMYQAKLPFVTLHSNRGLVPLPFQHCPRFHCKVIALKSRTFVVKSRTKFPRKFVRGLNAKPPIVPSPLRWCLASTPANSYLRTDSMWPPAPCTLSAI